MSLRVEMPDPPVQVEFREFRNSGYTIRNCARLSSLAPRLFFGHPTWHFFKVADERIGVKRTMVCCHRDCPYGKWDETDPEATRAVWLSRWPHCDRGGLPLKRLGMVCPELRNSDDAGSELQAILQAAVDPLLILQGGSD